MTALLVHGAGGGAWEWRIWVGVLRAQGVAVEAIELRPGAGGLAATCLDDYREQVMQALRRLPRPRVLVGASLGGLLAARCAHEADALVLVNPLPPEPWHAHLPARDWLQIVPWQRAARLASTREAMADADDASALYAFRHWRDESGAVLRQAHAGVAVEAPPCPRLLQFSAGDEEIPAEAMRDFGRAWRADLWQVEGGHLAPLLGRGAAACAAQAVAWLNTAVRAG